MSAYHRYIGRQIVVQLPELTLAGTLLREDKETLTLAEVAAISENGSEPKPVDGEVVIERAALTWSQVV